MKWRFWMPQIIAATVVALGTAVMVAWWLDIEFLKSLGPGQVTMKFSTALSFVCAGLILFSLTRNFLRFSDLADLVVVLASFMIFLLMGTMLFAIVLGINTGLENLFIREIETSGSSVPGRPSIGTMIAFLLMAFGGIIAGIRLDRSRRVLVRLGAVVGTIGLAAVIGYISGFPSLYWDFSNISNAMAFHTAGLFIILGLGFMLLRPAEDQPVMNRHWSAFHWYTSLCIATSVIAVAISALLVGGYLKVQIATQAIQRLEVIAHFQESRMREAISKYEAIADGISSRTMLRRELQAVETDNDLAGHNSQIQTILNDAIEPLSEIKEVVLFSRNNVPLVVAPQKQIYDDYQSLISQFQGKSFVPIKTRDSYTLYLIRPMVLEGRVIGTLVINFGPQLFLDVTLDYTGLGSTGETTLGFRSQDGLIEFLSLPRHWERSRPVKITETEVPIVQALVYRRNGTFESAADYRGTTIIAVSKYLSDLDWGMVVKMDKAEIFKLTREVVFTVTMIALIVTLFSVMVAVVFSQRLKQG